MITGQAALALARNGWEVLPLNGKVPLTRHGVDDASSRSAQVERWWRRWPDANIGGRVPPGLVVVDVDPRNGGAKGWAQITLKRNIPATLTTVTGRGDGGFHLYFQRPRGVLDAGSLPPGIDLKINGYCVLPPSIHPDTGGTYEWQAHPIAPLPDCLREILRPPTVRWRRPPGGLATSSRDALIRFVEEQSVGNRNSGLYWAAHRLNECGALDDAGAEALVDAAVRAGESLTAAQRTVASARRKSGQ